MRQQGYCRQDHARCTKPTLHGSVVDEHLLHRVQVLTTAQPFDGDRAAARYLLNRCQAGTDGLAIYQHGAGTALPLLIASLFRAGQMQVLAQHVQQRAARFDLYRDLLSVEGKVERFASCHAPHPRRDAGGVSIIHPACSAPCYAAITVRTPSPNCWRLSMARLMAPASSGTVLVMTCERSSLPCRTHSTSSGSSHRR